MIQKQKGQKAPKRFLCVAIQITEQEAMAKKNLELYRNRKKTVTRRNTLFK